jgi:HAE1 family hydrophobic/amphiphilic exporter-1
MWLVNAALRRPFTVWVGMLLVLVLGVFSYLRTPTDILPNLKVPVVVVFASYRGMPAPDMEQSVVSVLERALTRCDRLEHVESRSLLGIGIIRIYFRPEVDPDVAASQVISLVNGEMQNLPPGMLPPSIFKYDAASIPVGNLVISSASRDDKELLDLADHQLRDELAGIEGLASAPVFGGVFRQVQIYVHPRTLEALKLSPLDVARIVNTQSQVIPTGEIRIGPQNYYVSSNSMIDAPKAFEKIPLWTDGRKVVYLGDVAEVEDGTRWRTNTVRADGRRAVYMPLLRQAGASAVRVVDNVQAFLPQLHARGTVPDDVHVEVAFDQSEYVREALANLRWEALAGAALAALVVLLFLGNLRSTCIVALSIPLSVLAAFVGLYLTGHTLNIMTLGGLALVLGRVVDDSIVDVENTLRHMHLGKAPMQAALDSAREIAVPVLLATVTTVVVFLPVTLMAGVGRYLFTPLAVSASLAMFASYLVSRTVSPLCCARFLRPERAEGEVRGPVPWRVLGAGAATALLGLVPWGLLTNGVLAAERLPLTPRAAVWVARLLLGLGVAGAATVLVVVLYAVSPAFERLFQGAAGVYERLLAGCLARRWAVLVALAVCVVPAALALTRTGQELFPEVDSGEFTIHMRATGGPRVEETERYVGEVEDLVREVVPPDDLGLILSNIGVSSRWSAIYTSNNGPHAAFVRVQLRSGFAGRRTPTREYVERLRDRLKDRYPSFDFFFESGGMIRQILNNGAVAPVEIQVHGRDPEARRLLVRRIASRAHRELRQVTDAYMPQDMRLPQLRVEVDRTQAALLGLTESDVVRNVITSLMSSSQIAPNFWIDPSSGNPYFIGVQYPESQVENIQTLENIPLTGERGRAGASGARLLKDVAHITRGQAPVEVYHHNSGRVGQIFLSIYGHDLARTAAAVDRIARQETRGMIAGGQVPRDTRVSFHGEVESMSESFRELAIALGLAVLFVYLVMAAQFSSWLDPLITIVAAPLGLIGVAALLWLTDTSLNVQTCIGVLMMVGISVSNSVLLVEFANRLRAGSEGEAGLEPRTAILHAARVRLRPIVMTTLATVLGLLPMAVHLRPGDEMNLPLARAVIGGLLSSTLLTLFVVPVFYTLVRGRRPAPAPAAP